MPSPSSSRAPELYLLYLLYLYLLALLPARPARVGQELADPT